MHTTLISFQDSDTSEDYLILFANIKITLTCDFKVRTLTDVYTKDVLQYDTPLSLLLVKKYQFVNKVT